MEFIEAKCPNCDGELKIPNTLESVICMYCGKEFPTSDLCSSENKTDSLAKINLYKEKSELALEQIPKLLTQRTDLMNFFDKALYENAFNEYLGNCKESMRALDDACKINKDMTNPLMEDVIEHILMEVEANVSKNGKQMVDGNLISSYENYKMIFALFTVPMILELKLSISDSFVTLFMDRWIEKHPSHKFLKGSFEQLNEGFRKRRFCFITTAVCNTFEKSDDCYELMMFRNFRDEYLQKEEDGAKLIEEYYTIAPAIVAHIDMSVEKDAIYRSIWEEYLSVCLKDIESKENALCKDHYVRMVRDLQTKYCVS